MQNLRKRIRKKHKWWRRSVHHHLLGKHTCCKLRTAVSELLTSFFHSVPGFDQIETNVKRLINLATGLDVLSEARKGDTEGCKYSELLICIYRVGITEGFQPFSQAIFSSPVLYLYESIGSYYCHPEVGIGVGTGLAQS